MMNTLFPSRDSGSGYDLVSIIFVPCTSELANGL
jgi:hypothetical protein